MNIALQMEGLLQLVAKLCDERDVQVGLECDDVIVCPFTGNSDGKSEGRSHRWCCHSVR